MKYKSTKTLLLCSSLLAFSQSFAITLEEALPLAYKNSDALKVAEETFIQEIQAMSDAISGFMPRANANITMSNTKSSPNPGNGGVAGGDSMNNDTHTSQSVSVAQPIFNSGSSVFNLKAAEAQFKASRAKFYLAEQKELLSAVEVYLNFYEAEQKYKIAVESLEFREHEFDAAEQRLKLGEETITNVAAARAKLAQARAKKATEEAALQSNRAIFLKIFGVEPENISLPEVPAGLPENMDTMVSKSLVSSHSVDEAKNSVAAAKASSYSITASTLLPSVFLKGTFSRDRYSTERPMNYKNRNSVYTALSIDIPILSKGGAEFASIREKKSIARRMAHTLDDTRNSVKVEATTLWGQYEAQKASLVFAEEYVKAQTMALEGAKYEYEIGSKTMLDVFQIEDEYNNAKLTNVATQKSYIKTAYQILSSNGSATAKSLGLKVKYFNPDSEFKKLKTKFIGF